MVISLQQQLLDTVFNRTTTFPLMQAWWAHNVSKFVEAAYLAHPATYLIAISNARVNAAGRVMYAWDGMQLTVRQLSAHDLYWTRKQFGYRLGDRVTLTFWNTDKTLVVIGIDERRSLAHKVHPTRSRYSPLSAFWGL